MPRYRLNNPIEHLLERHDTRWAPQHLEYFQSVDWSQTLQISDVDEFFPMKVRVDNHRFTALVTPTVNCCVMNYRANPTPHKTKSMEGTLDVDGDIIDITGVYPALVQVGARVQRMIPMLVADLPKGINLIMGSNFLNSMNAEYFPQSDIYQFQGNGFIVSKNRAQAVERNEWEILHVKSEEEILKLFRVQVEVDGMKLQAALDTGAVRTILNSHLCTNTQALKPAKIKLKVANNSDMGVDGIYRPSLTFGGETVKCPVVCAKLPEEIDLLIGNDILSKLKSEVSWKSETALFDINGRTVSLQRLRGPLENSLTAPLIYSKDPF